LKLIKIAGLGLAGLVVLAILVLVFGLPAGPLIGYVADEAEKAGFQLRVAGPSSLSLWPSLNITADDVHLADAADNSEDVLAAKRLRISISLLDLLTGTVRVNEVKLSHPVVRVISGRKAGARTRAAQGEGAKGMVAVDQLVVEDGTLILRDVRENLSGQIDAIKLTAALPAQGALDVQAEGNAGGHKLQFSGRANSASQIADGRPTPVEFKLELPGVLTAPLSVTATLKAADQIITVDGIRGTLGSGRVNGSVSVDTAGQRPNVNAGLVVDRLEFAAPPPGSAPRDAPWSDKPIEFAILRVFNGMVKISAREVVLGSIRLASTDIESQLQSGLLSVAVSRGELYGGPVQGKLVIDADPRGPRQAATFDFSNVNALQLLREVASFDHLEGRLRAKLDVSASGASPYAIVSSLGGTADLSFEDGALRDVNIPAMVRALSSQTLQGWQNQGTEKTEFGTLTASFKLENGQATTDDLRLTGPLVRMTGKGTVNLVAQTLDFRVDPKVVLSLQGQQGQGGSSDPAGLGVPVVIRGPWAQPQIYPDIAGILDNPQAAFDKLKTLGGGLFGLLDPQPGGGGGGKKPKADEIIKSLDQAIKGEGGRSRADTKSQVRDVLKDLFGR